MTDAAGVEATLSDRPDLEPALETVLDVDRRADSWTFDDLPLDSGTFGELVSRGLVEEGDDGYRLADPEAVEAALAGSPAERDGTGDGGANATLPTPGVPAVDRTTAAVVAGALAFLAVVRLTPFPTVYRNGDVVLSGNDPYYYRYWVEQVAAAATSPFDVGVIARLPSEVVNGEPLTVAALWWVAELLGSGAGTVGHVLAWYPVVSAVVTAALLYLLAVRFTDDRRVGVASIVMLAILPGHALRTALGYADHHAFDYPWLAATALALVCLATVDRDRLLARGTVLASLGLGVAVTGQVLAWEAGPLLVVPVGIVVVGRALLDVRVGRSPLVAGGPVVAGLGVAAVLTWLVHAVADWQSTVVASTPALLVAGVAVSILVAEGVHRTTGDVRHLAVLDAVTGVGVALAVRSGLPETWATLSNRLGFLLGGHDAVETLGLFTTSTYGFLFLLGLALVLAVPMMAVGLHRSLTDGRWLVATVYAWYFLGLAALQVRFVGEFGAFAALFAGLGFVRLAVWVDVLDPADTDVAATGVADRARNVVPPLQVPDRRTVGWLFALFVLVGAFGGMQTVIETGQATIQDATYETAVAVEEHAAQQDLAYPENYVLSQWGLNRVYNYFVNGEANSYTYAQQTYAPFITAEDPTGWYDRLRDRVGYVVLENADSPPESMHSRLYDAYGSRRDGTAGLGHYQAIYTHGSGGRTAVALVPGARLTGTAPANATVSITTDVSIPAGTSFTYERRATADASGEYAVRLAYPGEYTVATDETTETVTVADAAVRDGAAVSP